MTELFTHEIAGWQSWGRVFQSIEAFAPLAGHILEKEGLAPRLIERCKPGTNAVFKAGAFVLKIFAPRESGLNTDSDYRTEIFGLERAARLGVSAPKLVAKGAVADKYLFRYFIMEYVGGRTLGEARAVLSGGQKQVIGRALREMTALLNTPCERFNDIDPIRRGLTNTRWDILPQSFNGERVAYLKRLRIQDEVYVHGDINPDNVLVTPEGRLCLIDFADAVLAPREYETAAIVCDLFGFDADFMAGYFGNENRGEIAGACLRGLLLHDFGATLIQIGLGNPDGISTIAALAQRLRTAITAGHSRLPQG